MCYHIGSCSSVALISDNLRTVRKPNPELIADRLDMTLSVRIGGRAQDPWFSWRHILSNVCRQYFCVQLWLTSWLGDILARGQYHTRRQLRCNYLVPLPIIQSVHNEI